MGSYYSISSLPATVTVSPQEERDRQNKEFVTAFTLDEMKAMIRDGLVDDESKGYGNILYKERYNMTALTFQCISRRIDTSRFLLEECNPPADPNLSDDRGNAALHYSMYGIMKINQI